ncbi:hypothetical protein ES706_05481 [subsurface metagenome]
MTTIMRDINVFVDRQMVYRYLGLRKNTEPNQQLSAAIDKQMEKVYELVEPLAGYSILPITGIEDSNIFIGSSTLKSSVLAKVLSNCHHIAIFLITIGDKLERKTTQLSNEGFMLEAYVLDAIGSVALVKATNLLTDKIRTIAAGDNKITSVFCPGQTDWDITQQETIFNIIDAHSIGVKLTDKFLMIPLKSLSGVSGIGKLENGQDKIKPCRFCDRENCPGRKEPFMPQAKCS